MTRNELIEGLGHIYEGSYEPHSRRRMNELLTDLQKQTPISADGLKALGLGWCFSAANTFASVDLPYATLIVDIGRSTVWVKQEHREVKFTHITTIEQVAQLVELLGGE